jgi:uncharacterized RDD family membrane protein YckC
MSTPTGFSGANALAPAFEASETQDFLPLPDVAPRQTTLFTSSGTKVIPFDHLQRQASGRIQPTAQPAAKPPRPAPKSDRSSPRSAAEQASLDFLSSPPAQRVLKTDVPAQIYCNRPVATPTHRFVAGAMDAAMVLMAFGLFVGITELAGGSFGTGRLFWEMLALSFALIAVFYGIAFAIMGRETAGMHWTDLQLITFDGFPVDGRSRAARVASTWLSFCSGGLGLVWALADEETLTWQDHISKTFPTVRETSGSFVRQV